VLPALLTQVSNFLFHHASSLGPSDSLFLTRQVADLVVACFRGSDRGSQPRRFILQSAMDEAMRRLSDPSLTISDLATHVSVSRRTLERLFAARGLTAARWILDRRLDRVRQDLVSDAAGGLSVAAVAERWGFVDRTSFSRAFRDRFDCSPGAYRRESRPR
jgi:AraC-like DNA-binding protein